MGLIKKAGGSAHSQRRFTMHGSGAERRAGVIQRAFEKQAEKPGNTFLGIGGNRNQRRGSSRPRRGRP